MTRGARWSWALCASCLLHGVLWAQGVRASRTDRREPPPRDLELRWVALAPPPEPPVAEPVPEPPPPRSVPAPKPVPVQEKAAVPAPPEPAIEPPRAASDVTVASDTLAGPDVIAAIAAPGALAFSGSIGGAGGGTATAPPPAPATKQVEPPVVALGDLSRRPRPPSLDGELERHYPAELRRRGVEGVAEVGLVVNAAGRVARVEILSETASGFANACRATLLGTEWSPPLDRAGVPVATRLKYRCRFEVEDP